MPTLAKSNNAARRPPRRATGSRSPVRPSPRDRASAGSRRPLFLQVSGGCATCATLHGSWAPWLRGRGELRQGFGGHHRLVSDLMVDAVIPATAAIDPRQGAGKLSLFLDHSDPVACVWTARLRRQRRLVIVRGRRTGAIPVDTCLGDPAGAPPTRHAERRLSRQTDKQWCFGAPWPRIPARH
jgi:hypothetical protein